VFCLNKNFHGYIVDSKGIACEFRLLTPSIDCLTLSFMGVISRKE